MRLFKLALVFALSAIFLSGCNGATETNQTANSNAAAKQTPTPALATPTPDEFAIVRGRFAQFCSQCHQVDGSGGEVKDEESGKTFKAPSLRAGSMAERHTDEQLARTISNGEEEMPSFKSRFSTEEINLLVRFIRKEFQGKTGSASAGNTNAPSSAH